MSWPSLARKSVVELRPEAENYHVNGQIGVEHKTKKVAPRHNTLVAFVEGMSSGLRRKTIPPLTAAFFNCVRARSEGVSSTGALRLVPDMVRAKTLIIGSLFFKKTLMKKKKKNFFLSVYAFCIFFLCICCICLFCLFVDLLIYCFPLLCFILAQLYLDFHA